MLKLILSIYCVAIDDFYFLFSGKIPGCCTNVSITLPYAVSHLYYDTSDIDTNAITNLFLFCRRRSLSLRGSGKDVCDVHHHYFFLHFLILNQASRPKHSCSKQHRNSCGRKVYINEDIVWIMNFIVLLDRLCLAVCCVSILYNRCH